MKGVISMFEERSSDQTITWAYSQICAGARPWTALGNFMNAWYGYAEERRPDLINKPLTQPEQDTPHTQHWGAFCAATAEYLSKLYDIPCPAWVHDPRYTLPAPWYGELEDLRQNTPEETARQMRIKTTPAPFKRRNIFCGDRLFRNKYEMAAWIKEARALGLTDRVEILRYAFTKERSIHGG